MALGLGQYAFYYNRSSQWPRIVQTNSGIPPQYKSQEGNSDQGHTPGPGIYLLAVTRPGAVSNSFIRASAIPANPGQLPRVHVCVWGGEGGCFQDPTQYSVNLNHSPALKNQHLTPRGRTPLFGKLHSPRTYPRHRCPEKYPTVRSLTVTWNCRSEWFTTC